MSGNCIELGCHFPDTNAVGDNVGGTVKCFRRSGGGGPDPGAEKAATAYLEEKLDRKDYAEDELEDRNIQGTIVIGRVLDYHDDRRDDNRDLHKS